MNILASSDDTLSSSDRRGLLNPSSSTFSPVTLQSAVNHSLITAGISNSTKSPALHHQSTNTTPNHKPFYSYNPQLNSSINTATSTITAAVICGSSPAYRGQRQKFAHNRSVSTEVPGRAGRSPLEPGFLSRPGSHSGPLERINSFDRGTQTAPKNSFNRLNIEHRQQARYESAISDIGVEYMKATGAIGIKFRQLQKPGSKDSQSRESVCASNRHLNYEQNNCKDLKSSNNSQDPASTTVLMNNSASKSSHVVKLNSTEQTDDMPSHHHIGYRLGRRKFLAERRRKIADLCCFFAMTGLALMILETECNIATIYSKVSIFNSSV